ncbi:hypothetical protein DPSP01_004111 [Paraphaeosphaeria sporulosa]
MDTLGQNIIVPLQVDEIKAGLNNSPYYHRHVFKSSGRSLEGLHPYPLRHIAMLSFKERAELLAQCEDIELQWDPETPRDEKWRYAKTRETLTKMSQHDIGGDQSDESVPDGTFPAVSFRFPRVQKALDERGSASPDKSQHLTRKFLTPDGWVAERDRILDMIAPRTVPASVTKMNNKTTSDEELLYAADMFKTSADQTEKKLAFLSPAFSQGSNANQLVSHHTTTSKPTRSETSAQELADESSQKPPGGADRDPQAEEHQTQNREGKALILEENGPLGHYVDIVANESFEEFQHAVAAAAAEDALSVAALFTNWKYQKLHPKISTLTDTEQDLCTALISHHNGEAATNAKKTQEDDACTVESLENLPESADEYTASHRFLKLAKSLHGGSDNMSDSDEEEMYQTTFSIGSGVPLAHRSTTIPAPESPSILSETPCASSGDSDELPPEDEAEDASVSNTSATESPHPMDPASDHENDSLVNPSIEPTTHPPEDEGTHTPDAPELVMPTFPLSASSSLLHKFVSDHASQVLHDFDQRHGTAATAIARSHVLQRSTPVPWYVDPAITAIDRGKFKLDDIAEAPEYTSGLAHHGDAHTQSGDEDNGLGLEDTHHQNKEHLHLPNEDADAALPNFEKHEQTLTPELQRIKSPLAQPAPPLAPAHVNPDDPVYEAVIFPNETKEVIAVHPGKPSKVRLDVPSLLNFDGEQIDDWAKDILAAIHNHKFLADLAASQHDIAAEKNDGEHIEVPDNGQVKFAEGHAVKVQLAKETPNIEVVPNHSKEAVQPTMLGTPAAVDERAVTLANWASLVQLNGHRLLEPENPAATPSIRQDHVQPLSLYPLPVYQERTESRSEAPLVRYLRVSAYHLSLILFYYVIVSFFLPGTSVPASLYLVASTFLGAMWAVLYYLQREPDKRRTARVVDRSKSTTKKRFIKICGTLLAVTAMIAAVAYGTTPGKHSRENPASVATIHAIQAETLAVCTNTLDWETVFRPITTCLANTLNPFLIIPRDPAINHIAKDSASVFDSDYESDSDIDDSYGKPKAVATRASSNWPSQLLGLGAGVLLAGVHIWWAQNGLEVYLKNYF